jgi:hypothetical protein
MMMMGNALSEAEAEAERLAGNAAFGEMVAANPEASEVAPGVFAAP